MTRFVTFTVAMGVLLLIPGCAMFGQQGPQTSVATDSFCLTARKRLWSVDDRPEAIAEARRWNYVVDKRCSAKSA